MGLLNNLFTSTERASKGILLDEASIIRHWTHYLETISKKKEIIDGLNEHDALTGNLRILKNFLDIELIDVSGEEGEESGLISNLEAISHSQKVRRIQKLERCLDYAATKYEYSYSLLEQLHSVLKSQIHLVIRLQSRPRDASKLISLLKAQSELELEILSKIDKVETFHNLFVELLKGEHIIATMDSAEKRLLEKMRNGMGRIFSNEITEGIAYKWTLTVFNTIEDKIHEGVANGMFAGYHPDIDFEFVNRTEFIELAKDCIFNLKKRKVSDPMINVFVHLFREWYNHERE